MTQNEKVLELLAKAARAHDLAEKYEAEKEPELAVFYYNGSKEFQRRARKAMNEEPAT